MAKNVWAHLRILERFDELAARGAVTDTGDQIKKWRLLCDCGHEFVISEDDFPGRRRMKNCGRPQCEYAEILKPKPEPVADVERPRPPGRPKLALADRGMNMMIYLPLRLIEAAHRLADRNGLSPSKVIAAALTEWLAGQKDE